MEVNEAFERVIGYRRDEIVDRSSLELNIWQNPEDRAIVLRMLAKGRKVRNLEFGFRSKSGTILVGLYSAEIIEIGEEPCLLSLVSDITARKKTEEALRQSEERYRRLYNDTPVMLHSIDPYGRLVSVSNCWLETLGYERSEVLGRISTDFHTAASRSYATDVVLPEFFRTGSCKEVPYQIVKKNGEIMDVLLSAIAERDKEGKVVRSLAVMVDVTERKRTEDALLKSEDKFSRIFHSAPVMICISTLTEGRFIDANESCLRLLGYQREELIGRTSLELGIWECHADRDRAIRTLEEQGTVHDLDVNLISKTGETMSVLFSMELLNIGDERYLLSLVSDITDRKRAEEEIKRLNTDLAARAADLEDANRELEAFNYTVAHDLRQPLNVIGINCQAIDMLCGDQLQEECKGYVQGAYNATLRMDQLIGALLNFSRMGHVEPSRKMVDMSALAHEVVTGLKLTEPERQVDFRIAGGIVANGDANLLRAVLDNLIGNAWKYTCMREKAVIELGVTDIGGVPAYFVRDNGKGFDKANADKLFAPFQRLPGAEECRGFGIGLATVERIIRRHGGQVWAEGEPDKGATFWFTI
jgi:PAS domain S-box-containing protein